MALLLQFMSPEVSGPAGLFLAPRPFPSARPGRAFTGVIWKRITNTTPRGSA